MPGAGVCSPSRKATKLAVAENNVWEGLLVRACGHGEQL